MEKFSAEQLNKMDKESVVEALLAYQKQYESMEKQLASMEKHISILTEQISLLTTRKFGRSTEKNLVTADQVTIYDCGFNEAEALIQGQTINEPEIETVIVAEHKRRKHKGKRAEDLSGFPVKEIEHALSEEELAETFPEGYTRLPDEVYKKLEMHPATFEVLEHHIAVYKGKNGKVVKANHPKEMINNSIATPSLVSAIINAKYVNAVPLYRQEQEYQRNDINISRQVMANWMILVAERYISLVYDRLKEELKTSHVIHADETPVTVVKDGRDGLHKNYMWVYRSGDMCRAKPVVLYDYQRTRKADAPDAFLTGFDGKLVCDGYQVYHTLENKADTRFEVAGCWAHARRKFADVVKSAGKSAAKGTVAGEAVARIGKIYDSDREYISRSPSARKKHRETEVRKLVEQFFEWARTAIFTVPPSSATAKAFQYCLNQEKYLKVFLTDPSIPMDNNIAERAIRPFCVGKKNWNIIATMNGAEASAILYSIVETAKANNLNIYQYFKYLLTEIPKHMDDTAGTDFISDLLPWSKTLPDECHKKIVK